jgi:hypothetical protein
MPDITMCNGVDFNTHAECPYRNTCYRFLAEPDEYAQAYFVSAPYEEGRGCDYYWETSPEEHKK